MPFVFLKKTWIGLVLLYRFVSCQSVVWLVSEWIWCVRVKIELQFLSINKLIGICAGGVFFATLYWQLPVCILVFELTIFYCVFRILRVWFSKPWTYLEKSWNFSLSKGEKPKAVNKVLAHHGEIMQSVVFALCWKVQFLCSYIIKNVFYFQGNSREDSSEELA